MEGVSGEGDDWDSDALDGGQEFEDFGGFSGGGESQDEVAAHDHAEISVQGFGGMEVEGGGSGGCEGGGEFAADESTLAHAGDDDASGAGEDEFEGALEVGGHGPADAVGEAAQGFGFNAYNVFGSSHDDNVWTHGGQGIRRQSLLR
jgi:hypothetical protein